MNTIHNPYAATVTSENPGTDAPPSTAARWLGRIVRFFVILLLTIPLVIVFQIAAMLVTGRGTQGFMWLAIGMIVVPIVLSCGLSLFEKRGSVKASLVRGVLMGITVSVALCLAGFALMVVAYSFSRGI